MRKKQQPSTRYTIRRASPVDLCFIAKIHTEVFTGSNGNIQSALSWARSQWKSAPTYQYYVIAEKKCEHLVLGYAGWQMHGGFDRIEPVVELDQIGIAPEAQGKGLGEILIRFCADKIASWLGSISSRCLGHVSIVVWGYADNAPALALYKKIFTEGTCGERTQFENRKELMLRWRVPVHGKKS